MESVIAVFMVVSVMVLSVYFANWIKEISDEKHRKLNDVFTFCLPCVATMAIGIAVISDILLLPIVITAALLAGTMSLLVSLTEEQKSKQSKSEKVDLRYIVFVVFRNCSMPIEQR
jgi:Na+/H+ antiporter NhaD/arsenite permease-like protein